MRTNNNHKASNRFLLSLLVVLALILVAFLPFVGHRLIHEFRTVLTRQVLDDNRAIARTFVAYARTAWEQAGEREDEWLQMLRRESSRPSLPGRRYICLVDDFGRVRLSPPEFADESSDIAVGLIEPYNREFRTFDTLHVASLQDLVVSLREGEGLAGRCRGPDPDAPQNLVYYERFTVGGRTWLAGVHQIEGEMKADLDQLFRVLVMLGVGLIFIIVMASFLVMRRLVRRYEQERACHVDQIKKHAQEIEQANEQLRALQESKNRLYSHLSHDLRAPLNSVVSACELLKLGNYGPVTEQQSTAMDRVIRNAEVLVRLIDQILQLTRLETGQWGLEVAPFRLETVLENVVDNLRPLAEQKGVSLSAHTQPELPLIHSDQEKVYLIFQNLVGNALKYTDQGEVEVTARMSEDDNVEISVRDTGPGIPADKREQIFREFEVIKDKERRYGVGLGLSITRELTHLVGGSIHLDSEVGRGSTFTVRLPVRIQV